MRHDISTGEISPAAIMSHYDEKLARYPYAGLRCGGENPIGIGAVWRASLCWFASLRARRRGRAGGQDETARP